jgi:tetratricopeptide (TPR) repeat protein
MDMDKYLRYIIAFALLLSGTVYLYILNHELKTKELFPLTNNTSTYRIIKSTSPDTKGLYYILYRGPTLLTNQSVVIGKVKTDITQYVDKDVEITGEFMSSRKQCVEKTCQSLGGRTTVLNISTITKTPITKDKINEHLAIGVEAREKGDYANGERYLSLAFEQATDSKNKAVSVEVGNNLSIQYRLIAGRYIRQGNKEKATRYSIASMDVYNRLKELQWFDEEDPVTARNWAHALLYAGKVDLAIPALQKSMNLQTTQGAKGDELCHITAAFTVQRKFDESMNLIDECIALIKTNNGSKVWLTFGLMEKATILAQLNKDEEARTILKEAHQIAKENKLAVRDEEITYIC